jgi:hypothetical protein
LLLLQTDFNYMGIVVDGKTIEDAVDKARNELYKFAYVMCGLIFKAESAKYFSIKGSTRSAKIMETLALPSDYTFGFCS